MKIIEIKAQTLKFDSETDYEGQVLIDSLKFTNQFIRDRANKQDYFRVHAATQFDNFNDAGMYFEAVAVIQFTTETKLTYEQYVQLNNIAVDEFNKLLKKELKFVNLEDIQLPYINEEESKEVGIAAINEAYQ